MAVHQEPRQEQSKLEDRIAQLLRSTTQYTATLSTTRQSLQSLPVPRLPVLRAPRFNLDYWTHPYLQSDPSNSGEDQSRSKQSARAKELEVVEKTFVCPGCSRELPISRKFARKMCQACYKRYLKAQQRDASRP